MMDFWIDIFVPVFSAAMTAFITSFLIYFLLWLDLRRVFAEIRTTRNSADKLHNKMEQAYGPAPDESEKVL